mgnify:CR=1 FL=1
MYAPWSESTFGSKICLGWFDLDRGVPNTVGILIQILGNLEWVDINKDASVIADVLTSVYDVLWMSTIILWVWEWVRFRVKHRGGFTLE